MLQPHQRMSRLHMITLASTVALVGAVPLAAAVAGQDARLAARAFEAAQPRHDGSARPAHPASACGPEIASPAGVKARACVVTRGEEVWARASYRNATDRPLHTVLTLRGPDGRTTRVHCTVRVTAERSVCETPREDVGRGFPDAAARRAYLARTEVSSRDGARRLLRAGSNSAPTGGS
ncbi:hypothetical protein FM076_16175 [Streptomyces albus subsp. chlorinus]|uniref:hypothetical protein n=1 Tax=Streptomyces albus TaxID=1888 RepID=UPI0015706CE0|nr:hypothetical protein [Streptomyces albus]NSC22624.1 hypothetical protein [Streptomyces albus subsp. chlorinus]